MKKLLKIIAVLIIYTIFISTASATTKNLSGTQWVSKNYHSIFRITSVSKNGLLIGTYQNQAPQYPCNSIYLVTGWLYGDVISFTTKWQNSIESCNSITIWIGKLNVASDQISVNWDLVRDGYARQEGVDLFLLKK